MSILSEKSRKVLVESMRSCVCDILKESATLTAKQAKDRSKFVSEGATYEQLLNITMNPDRDTKYLPSHVLEGAVAVLHSACMTGRYKIGVNAITEGAIKLQKETGAVITESMLDAALASVERGSGLKVVGRIICEAKTENIFSQMVSGYVSREAKSGALPGLDATQLTTLTNNIRTAADDTARRAAIQAKQTAINDAIKRRTEQLYNAVRTDPSKLPPDLINRLGGIDNVKQLQNGGVDVFTKATGWSKAKRLRDEISSLERRLSTQPINARNPREVSRLKSLKQGLSRTASRGGIPSRVGYNPSTSQMVNKALNGGSGWKNGLIGAGIAGAAALGGAYLWNKRKQNLQDQQDAYQQ